MRAIKRYVESIILTPEERKALDVIADANCVGVNCVNCPLKAKFGNEIICLRAACDQIREVYNNESKI